MLFVTYKPMRKYVADIISRSARRVIFGFLELTIYRHNLDLLTLSLDAGSNLYAITNTLSYPCLSYISTNEMSMVTCRLFTQLPPNILSTAESNWDLKSFQLDKVLRRA